MKKLLFIILSLGLYLTAFADNFILRNGMTAKVYTPKNSGPSTVMAGQLLQQDYKDVFGASLIQTENIADAKIIACSMDNAELKKYAKLRNISFNSLSGHKGAFILKVHNNGHQLFVVGSDDQGTAFGLMTLSRQWGVSPFCWLDDAPALPRDSYELGVSYEKLFEASIPRRTLIVNGVQPENEKIKELLLRLRANGVSNEISATPEESAGVFRWSVAPAIQPYLGLQMVLEHPERMRIEAVRAYRHGLRTEWQLQAEHQLCGEFQTLLFFDMAWDLSPYMTEEYTVDKLEDLHYTQVSGVESSWSQLMNDFYDLVMQANPDQPISIESLRRGIGESQQMALQLSMDLSERAVPSTYANSYFRNVEYPLNMATAQIQRLCNMQLDQHGAGNSWSADDCRQRMELLANKLSDLTTPKWRVMMESLPFPNVIIGQSLMRKDGAKFSKLKVGGSEDLVSDVGTEIIYKSKRATGTQIVAYQPLRLPLKYQAKELHLKFSFLPTKAYGKKISCLVYVDQNTPQLIQIDPQSFPEERQQLFDLTFNVDPSIEKHEIVFRTMSDGIYLQRVWLCDMK